jgi:hypothetical protein
LVWQVVDTNSYSAFGSPCIQRKSNLVMELTINSAADSANGCRRDSGRLISAAIPAFCFRTTKSIQPDNLTRNIIDIRPVGLLPGDCLGFHFNTRYQDINTLLAATQKADIKIQIQGGV